MSSIPAETETSICLTGLTGTGVRTVAQALVEAALLEGRYIQLFDDNFVKKGEGEEVVYARVSSSVLKQRNRPEKIEGGVFFEQSLLGSPEITNRVNHASWVLINTKKSLRELSKTFKSHSKIYVFNASEIARYFIEKDFPGLPMLGGLLKINPLVEISSLEKVIREKFKDRWDKELLEKNLIALRMGYNEINL